MDKALTTQGRAATHFGSCQICGHEQKLPKGTLSLHGYTKRWGFFSGTCPGSRALPFEQSIGLIENQIASCKLSIEVNEDEIETLKTAAGTVAWVHVYIPATYSVRTSSYVWRQLEVSINKYGAAVAVYEETTTSGTKRMREAEFGYAKTITEAVAYGNARRTLYHVDQIANLRSYIAWQEERIAGWAPKELKAVDPTAASERKGPLVHLRGNYYSASAHACAASAMAAQQYRPTTTKESEVTCTKCLARIAQAKGKGAA